MERKRQAVLISNTNKGVFDPDNKDFRVTDSSDTHCYISNINTREDRPNPGAVIIIEPADERVPNLEGIYYYEEQKYDPLYWKVVANEGE